MVIGAGSAGLVSALVAAKAGAKVTLIEANEMGSDCLSTGCVPSKAIIHAARLVAQARAAARMGLLGPTGALDSAAAMRYVRSSIAAVAPHGAALPSGAPPVHRHPHYPDLHHRHGHAA